MEELWADHHFKFHFACSERECHGLMGSVFKTAEELEVRSTIKIFSVFFSELHLY